MSLIKRLLKAVRRPGLIFEKIWLFLLNPRAALLALWRRYPLGSFARRMEWDIISRPPYAFGIYHAADLARRLGVERISVVEFEVGTGRGLLSMERIAAEVETIFGVAIEIYGFDTGVGLPPPRDYRDLPHVWSASEFRMDLTTLQPSLRRAKLVLGDVANTVGSFIVTHRPAPIAFVSVDVDYYSSAGAALQLFDADSQAFLPRVLCYFDDTLGTNSYVGEFLAIDEFNAAHKAVKIAPIHGLTLTRRVPAFWNAGMHVLNFFEHRDYNRHTGDVPHFAG